MNDRLQRIMSLGMIYVVLFFAFCGVSYAAPKYQGVAGTVVYNEDIEGPVLLIATQQSSFKDEVVKGVVNALKSENIKIVVTDVTKLDELSSADWDGAIVITTVESGQIQKDSHKFLEDHASDMDRIGVIYTADSGSWGKKDLDVDAVSSASKLVNVEPNIKIIVDKSYEVLQLSK